MFSGRLLEAAGNRRPRGMIIAGPGATLGRNRTRLTTSSDIPEINKGAVLIHRPLIIYIASACGNAAVAKNYFCCRNSRTSEKEFAGGNTSPKGFPAGDCVPIFPVPFPSP